jgi:hypothetical protein
MLELRYFFFLFIHNLMLGYYFDDRNPPNVES